MREVFRQAPEVIRRGSPAPDALDGHCLADVQVELPIKACAGTPVAVGLECRSARRVHAKVHAPMGAADDVVPYIWLKAWNQAGSRRGARDEGWGPLTGQCRR